MKLSKKIKSKPYFKTYASILANISAAFFITPFVGITFNLPNSYIEVSILIADYIAGIIFLIISAEFEGRS